MNSTSLIEQIPTDKKNSLLWFIMANFLLEHPLPWRAEKDWSAEVYDAQNICFMKFRSMDDAEQFIIFATDFSNSKEAHWETTREELGIGDK